MSMARYEPRQRRAGADDGRGAVRLAARNAFAIRAGVAGGVGHPRVGEQNLARHRRSRGHAVATLEPLAGWANVSGGAEWSKSSAATARLRWCARRGGSRASLPPVPFSPRPSFRRCKMTKALKNPAACPRNRAPGLVRCLQEIWRMERSMPGLHEVRRTVTLVSVDPRTGDQSSLGASTKYYRAAPETLLEEIYDENAADDLPPTSPSIVYQGFVTNVPGWGIRLRCTPHGPALRTRSKRRPTWGSMISGMGHQEGAEKSLFVTAHARGSVTASESTPVL